MVVLYTSSEGAFDELTNFRCMLVRLLLQHHCVVYEERDVQLTQFESEFQERLGGEKTNIPQVFMQGFNVGVRMSTRLFVSPVVQGNRV